MVHYSMTGNSDTGRVKSHRNWQYSEDSVAKWLLLLTVSDSGRIILKEEGLLQLMQGREPGRALD